MSFISYFVDNYTASVYDMIGKSYFMSLLTFSNTQMLKPRHTILEKYVFCLTSRSHYFPVIASQ